MSYLSKLAVITPVAIIIYAHAVSAQASPPPADNDDSYKLPLFVPKVAQPTGGKVVFDSASGGENDEIYSLPKRAAAKPSALSPAAGPAAAQKNYDQQYQEYQRQMQLYNEQMVEYKKQLATQQQQESQAPGDNDTTYVLPGQYMPAKKGAKPKPVAVKPPVAAQPAIQPAAAAPVQAQQPAPVAAQPQPQPKQAPAAAAQYNQRYNYSDENERGSSGQTNSAFPNYYY